MACAQRRRVMLAATLFLSLVWARLLYNPVDFTDEF
jgi:hypothetical protein